MANPELSGSTDWRPRFYSDLMEMYVAVGPKRLLYAADKFLVGSEQMADLPLCSPAFPDDGSPRGEGGEVGKGLPHRRNIKLSLPGHLAPD